MKTTGMRGKLLLLTISILAAPTLIACQSSPPQISIDEAGAELSPAVVGESMVTMHIRNEGGPDVLTAVKTDMPGAKASFHVMQGERMVDAALVKIPAKSTMEFKMGGSHIMLEGMPQAAKAGSKFTLILVFQKSGEKQIPLVLRETAMPMGHEHHM